MARGALPGVIGGFCGGRGLLRGFAQRWEGDILGEVNANGMGATVWTAIRVYRRIRQSRRGSPQH